VDRPLNRALYYSDFGRYGQPLCSAESRYISDINVSYKRGPMMAVKSAWQDAYQETLVHSAFRSSGERLYLDSRPVVYQRRPPISLLEAIRERVAWGRVFGRIRTAEISNVRRFIYAAGTFVLPVLISGRVFTHMRRQRQTFGRMLTTLAVTLPLSIAWAIGELSGYLTSGAVKRNPMTDAGMGERGVFEAGVIETNGNAN
jgi:hypothetical protein